MLRESAAVIADSRSRAEKMAAEAEAAQRRADASEAEFKAPHAQSLGKEPVQSTLGRLAQDLLAGGGGQAFLEFLAKAKATASQEGHTRCDGDRFPPQPRGLPFGDPHRV